MNSSVLFIVNFIFLFINFVKSDEEATINFPSKTYFQRKAHYFDSHNIYRGGFPTWSSVDTTESCTQASNLTFTSPSFCQAWSVVSKGTTGNCSCQVPASSAHYCTEYYCQQQTGKSYAWQRCSCTKPFFIPRTGQELTCDAWTCETGTSSDSNFRELWNHAPPKNIQDWECSNHKWSRLLTSTYCQQYAGGEQYVDNNFKMTGCYCLSDYVSDAAYCLQYLCQTFTMELCDLQNKGCGVVGLVVPVAGCIGAVFFVCLVYSMCFSGPKDTMFDKMGCFDFDWYDGLGCWFNFLQSTMSCSLCCQLLVWFIPLWWGGCGMAGLILFGWVSIIWGGIWSFLGLIGVYFCCFGVFKFMTPKLFFHCRCRVNHHSTHDAGWHVSIMTYGFIEVRDNNHLSWQPDQSMTLEFWIRPSTYQDCALFEKPSALDDSPQTFNFQLAMLPNGKLELSDLTHLMDTEGVNFIQTEQKLKKNCWNHVALVYNSTSKEMMVYLNGKVDTVATWGPGPANNEPLLICHGDEETWFHGRLAEIRFWKVARTESEIKDHMNSRIRGLNESLALYLRLDETDQSSGNGKNGEGHAQDRSVHASVGILHGNCHYVAMHHPDIEEEPTFPTIPLSAGPREQTTFFTTGHFHSLAKSREFTLEAWVFFKPMADTSKIQMIVDKGHQGYGIGCKGSNLHLFMHDHDYDTLIDLVPGEWQHVGVTVDLNLVAKFYINGEIVRNAEGKDHHVGVMRAVKHEHLPLTIGYRVLQVQRHHSHEDVVYHPNEGSDFWEGKLAEVRAWGAARDKFMMQRAFRLAFYDDREPEVGVSVMTEGLTLQKAYLDNSDHDLYGCWKLFESQEVTI